MQGKIIKGIAGFYYVDIAESGIMNVKPRGFSGKKIKNLWLAIT